MNDDVVTVLAVEDEELLLRAIEMKLTKAGKRVIGCPSAEFALEKLSEMSRPPDVIWLDYYLKDMNGLQFMYKLKENPAWAHIPVVVVSNSASPDKVSQMLALGVKKYFLKAESKLEDLVTLMDEIKSHSGGKKE